MSVEINFNGAQNSETRVVIIRKTLIFVSLCTKYMWKYYIILCYVTLYNNKSNHGQMDENEIVNK